VGGSVGIFTVTIRGKGYFIMIDTLTDKQRKAAMLPKEMPPCVGNPGVPCKSPKQIMLIEGFDDKVRCSDCNRIHVELVYKEAGEGVMPNSVAPKVKAVTKNKDEDRLKRILKNNAPRDGWTEPPVMKAAPGDIVDLKTARTKQEGMSDNDRRMAILKKYGKK
jgi:hypothetical protein